ncbi:MAG: hypothetical protein WC179_08830 [Candidatus Cloacimonadaceae bacterium]|jgi:hypothetical protein
MSLKNEINTLITEIIDDECKTNPKVKMLINKALMREMCSGASKDNASKINQEYDSIVSKCLTRGK